MNLIKQIVNKKLNHISTKELLKYSKEYEVSITTAQADQIVLLMKGKNINIYDNNERLELLKQIAKVTYPCYCPTSKYFISATIKIRRGKSPPYCALIFSRIPSSKVPFFSISISNLYGGFLSFLSSPTYGVSRIFGTCVSCG